MTFGALIRNESGEVQIDGTLKNHEIVQSGSTSAAVYRDVVDQEGFSVVTAYKHTITISDPDPEFPLVFVDPALSKIAGFAGVTKSGSNYATVSFLSLASSARSYYLAKPTRPVAGAGYGMQVFNAAGACVFDSRVPYARIDTGAIHTPGTLTSGSFDTGLDIAAGQYLMVNGLNAFSVLKPNIGISDIFKYRCFFWASSGDLRFSWFEDVIGQSNVPPFSHTPNPNVNALIIAEGP